MKEVKAGKGAKWSERIDISNWSRSVKEVNEVKGVQRVRMMGEAACAPQSAFARLREIIDLPTIIHERALRRSNGKQSF